MAISTKTHVYVEFKDFFFPFQKGEKVFIKKEVAKGENYVNRIKILDFPSQKNNNKPKAPVVPEATIRELTKKLQEAGVEIPKNAKKADLEALIKELESKPKAPVVPDSETGDEIEEEEEESVEIPVTGIVGDEVEEKQKENNT